MNRFRARFTGLQQTVDTTQYIANEVEPALGWSGIVDGTDKTTQ